MQLSAESATTKSGDKEIFLEKKRSSRWSLSVPRDAALIGAIFVCLCAALVSCSAPKELLLGFSGSLSGTDYLLGVEGRNAAELFVAQTNSKGGIKGRKLKLIVEDVKSDPNAVVKVDEALLDAGAIAIVGHFTSAAAESALGFASAKRIALVSPTATAESLSGKDDFLFRTVMSSKRDPEILIDHMRSKGREKLLIIATAGNSAYTSTYIDYARANSVAAGLIVYENLADASAERLKSFGAPDAVLIVASSLDTGTIAQRLRLAEIRAPIYASGWAGNGDLIEYGGAAVEGSIFVHQIDAQLPSIGPFAAAYLAAYGSEPSFGAIETWDSMLFATKAMALGGTDRESFYEAARSIRSFEGISGPIRIDEFGDASRPLHIKEVRSGRIVVVGTAN